MNAIVNLYSTIPGEIQKFLKAFYDKDSINVQNDLKWEQIYKNPVDMADIIGTFIDNSHKFNINMWISFDEDVFINVTSSNSNSIIKYLFERFPY